MITLSYAPITIAFYAALGILAGFFVLYLFSRLLGLFGASPTNHIDHIEQGNIIDSVTGRKHAFDKFGVIVDVLPLIFVRLKINKALRQGGSVKRDVFFLHGLASDICLIVALFLIYILSALFVNRAGNETLGRLEYAV